MEIVSVSGSAVVSLLSGFETLLVCLITDSIRLFFTSSIAYCSSIIYFFGI